MNVKVNDVVEFVENLIEDDLVLVHKGALGVVTLIDENFGAFKVWPLDEENEPLFHLEGGWWVEETYVEVVE